MTICSLAISSCHFTLPFPLQVTDKRKLNILSNNNNNKKPPPAIHLSLIFSKHRLFLSQCLEFEVTVQPSNFIPFYFILKLFSFFCHILIQAVRNRTLIEWKKSCWDIISPSALRHLFWIFSHWACVQRDVSTHQYSVSQLSLLLGKTNKKTLDFQFLGNTQNKIL